MYSLGFARHEASLPLVDSASRSKAYRRSPAVLSVCFSVSALFFCEVAVGVGEGVSQPPLQRALERTEQNIVCRVSWCWLVVDNE